MQAELDSYISEDEDGSMVYNKYGEVAQMVRAQDS